MSWVQGGTYSFMEASMKPERHIYEQAVKKSGLRPEQILFIDDLEKNVLAARDLGLQAVHYDLYSSFASKLKLNYPELAYLL